MAGRDDAFRPRPGYQGSQTTGAEVTIYTLPNDPVYPEREEQYLIDGKNRSSESHSLVSVSTQKQMGVAGAFSLTIKPGRSGDPLDQFVDDDWVDITFTKFGTKWHTMRGMIDDVRKQTMVGGSGATTEMYVITGRDFQKIFEATPIWFNPYAGENVEGGAALQVFSQFQNMMSLPASDVIQAFLFGFIQQQGDFGRNNWIPPQTMPGITTNDGILPSLTYDPGLLVNDPERTVLSPNFLMPNGTAWGLAQEWSDPLFNELWCDLLPIDGGQLGQPDQLSVEDTKMHIIARERPFPNLTDGQNSTWFSLPLWITPRENFVSLDVGRSGYERFNAFFAQPNMVQEVIGAGGIELTQPEWNSIEINKHGLRRFDVNTKYTSPKADLLGMSEALRLKIRDWYMLNPYLLNGQIPSAVGLPEIKVGSRIRIPGATTENDDLTFYVEGVAHTWQHGVGMRTTLTVTRGWKGTDDSLLQAMNDVSAGYGITPRAEPGGTLAEAEGALA